ncbi:hypothetical protein J2Y45_006682 [Dyadobacter sp. BE34]|uniref:Uncharacterized protein n=1 Tax=Dyadobacter fermentans TaxID=94254 RepID=A0ABU1R9M1_9BACT|nr:hypothetical protein [Dyadobacter fermentans]MDR7047282.1 hypothetical protein [Dyadobacter sp. BE242]MDR7201518.1 hypothetical protein [Dyadobacter sp. BE34]MDR7219388.1 hypothetical protein [Dyadobacter sp. BE31]MDR7267218.1 hypothetical protein [Dyadobacter sp. BE32]
MSAKQIMGISPTPLRPPKDHNTLIFRKIKYSNDILVRIGHYVIVDKLDTFVQIN